ncbi:MAG: hypothetical protein AB9842_11680 [Bacteroidales bacterium]
MMNKDALYTGITIALLAPIAFFILAYAIIYLLVVIIGVEAFLPLNSLILLSVAPNFLLVRYFYNKKKFEQTGQGVLFITVGMVLVFFIFIHGRILTYLPGLQG